MGQVSYGTITITDTTDIERIYPVYCKGGDSNAPSLQPLINWSENIATAGGGGKYIWQRIVAKKQGITVTANDYSDAVRLTGDDGSSLTISSTQYAQTENENDTPSYGNSMPSSINEGWWLWVKVNYSDGSSVETKIKQGEKGDQGISITGTKEIYFLKRTTDSVPTAPADGVITISTSTGGGVWTTVVPNYVEGGVYYTSIQTSYSDGISPKSSPAVINQGLTNANQKALDAYNTSIARDTEINAMQAQAKHYWWDNQGAHVAAGENTTNVNNITQGSPSTYGFNSLMAPGYLALKHKNIDFTVLATNSLTFYRPATDDLNNYVQGKKAMDLTADALTFYKPLAYNSSNEPTAAAALNANGLILSEGGIQAGTAGQSGFIYLSTKNYGSNLTINSHQASNWREVIGTKFGVDEDGNLYASNAEISGKITVGSGSNVYSKTEADEAFDEIGAASAAQTAAISSANSYTDGKTANMATTTDAVYRTQRIYRRYTTAQSNLSGPTTWVTANTDIYNDWTTKIPPLTSGTTKYSYLYTAIQTQTVIQYNNGLGTNCSCSIVLLDDTTTIIDGGTIIAGSVTANEITGSKLSAIYADMGNITAGNITKGYNSINFDNSPATLEFKNNTTWTNATKGIQWTGSDLNIKGNITATSLIIGSGATVSGVVVPNDISDMATKTTAQGYANDASYSVEIEVSIINFVNNNATLIAHPYFKGIKLTNSTTPALSIITGYSWSRADGTAIPSNVITNAQTLQLPNGSDLSATYVCTISKD